MAWVLLDTNILLRSVQPSHPMYREAADAINALRAQGEELCLTSQNLVEFRAVCTRPLGNNGLGMSQAQVKTEIARLKSLFRLLPESPAILPEWERLVDSCGAEGK
ncbi:MAG TPA: PIN domain-containing protein [Chthonomonadaceae bacterium]|nr:PIN domain-containing protein [Chthonomonadaceae bacterium]